MTHPLLERLDALVLGSTLPSTVDVDLRAFLHLRLEAQSGRAEGAALARAARSEAIRAGIRDALGSAPLGQPSRVLVGLVVRRYENRGKRPPARSTIADEVTRAKILETSESKLLDHAATVPHRSRREREHGKA